MLRCVNMPARPLQLPEARCRRVKLLRRTRCEAPVGAAVEEVQVDRGRPGQQALQACRQLGSAGVGHGVAPVSDPACAAQVPSELKKDLKPSTMMRSGGRSLANGNYKAGTGSFRSQGPDLRWQFSSCIIASWPSMEQNRAFCTLIKLHSRQKLL